MKDNQLFPVFLKLNQLKLLIVGGGNIALEKLTTILNNSPLTDITIVSKHFHYKIVELVDFYSNIALIEKPYHKNDLNSADLIIAATDNGFLNNKIYKDAKRNKILINVVDQPELCDFYMSSIVNKGHLKLAFSSNGLSPTTSKRLRQFFEDVLPEDINELILELHQIRRRIKGDLREKVNQLNLLTKTFENTNFLKK